MERGLAGPSGHNAGVVYLVGAGPGDPELITVKGQRLLRSADVVVYDRLISSAQLREVRPGAELIYVGKEAGCHTLPQAEINALLIDRGQRGLRVVRLKGGDPFVFGRGGEEAEALVAAGVRFEVVPGVTSAIAVPAYAGIPVTHRDYATTLTVVTGHKNAEGKVERIRWGALTDGTLVFMMSAASLDDIATQLTAHGRPKETPAAVVEWGTFPQQRVVDGTLETIAERVREAGLGAPSVAIVGEVAGLRAGLAWLEHRPLAGKKVLVTRTRQQAGTLSTALSGRGAQPVEFPVITIAPAENYDALDMALANAGRFDWAVFTSVNAVQAVDKRLATINSSWQAFSGARICAIGPQTAHELRARGCHVALVPQRFVAEAILEEMPEVTGQRLLLARADIADRRLADGLRKRGALIEEYVAYRTLLSIDGDEAVLRQILSGDIDVVTFTSSSTVRNLHTILGDAQFAQVMDTAVVACIGPITAATARELGAAPDVVAETYTIEGLVDAVERYFAMGAGTVPTQKRS